MGAALAPEDDHRVEQEWVLVGSLSVDPRYQRPLIEARVKKIANDFDPEALGTVEVARRANGVDVLMDGQYRVAALRLMGWEEQYIPALVHYGLTLSREAQLFKLLNTSAKPTPMDIFRARLTAGDHDAQAIREIVQSVSLRVGDGHAEFGVGIVRAIKTVERIYRLQPEALRRTLRTATAAWGRSPEALHGSLLMGLGYLYVMRGASIRDEADVVQVLRTITPGVLLAKSKEQMGILGGHVGPNVAALLVRLLNKGRKRYRIQDIDVGTSAALTRGDRTV